MEKSYKHFEDNDENKLIYTTIHKDYTNLIEKYLETQLKKKIENFSMKEFMNDLMLVFSVNKIIRLIELIVKISLNI